MIVLDDRIGARWGGIGMRLLMTTTEERENRWRGLDSSAGARPHVEGRVKKGLRA